MKPTDDFRVAIAFATLLLLQASAQIALFVLASDVSPLLRYGAIAAALLALPVAWRTFRFPSRQAAFVTVVLLAVNGWLCTLQILQGSPPFEPRLLFAAGLLVPAAGVLAGLTLPLRRTVAAAALLLTVAVAAGMLAAEVVLDTAFRERPGAIWAGGTVPHPLLGEFYPPNTTAKTYYPSDPRNYFTRELSDTANWSLNDHRGVGAQLTTLSDSSFRVELPRASGDTAWLVQVVREPLALQRNRLYSLTFRMRTTRSTRSAAIAVAQNQPPWRDLGLYQTIELDTTWSEHRSTFSATAADRQARLVLDLGGAADTVHIDNIVLRDVASRSPVQPVTRVRYSVTYRFNSLGCRGADYAVPKPAGVIRILALGDSYTLGVGVHEEDTYTAQLERLLNAHGAGAEARRYEVVNCGISGYDTRQERLHYELVSSAYEPDIVLLAMVHNDDRSWLEDVRLGYVYRPDRLAGVLRSWGLIQRARHRRPPPDFTRSTQELIGLDYSTRQRGARLAVVIYDHYTTQDNERLRQQVAQAMQGQSIPVLELGHALRTHPPESLSVHQVDAHPNQRAHQLAARQIAEFLQQQGLLSTTHEKEPR